MPLIEACCCFDGTLRTGSRNSAIYSTITSFINICIGIWALVSIHWVRDNMEANEVKNFLAPGLLPILYIMFFMTIAQFCLSLGLWIGVNRGFEGRTYATMWVYIVVAMRIIGILLGTYIVVWMGKHLIVDVLFIHDIFYALVMYFVIDHIVLLVCVVTVISYWQELREDIFHKHYRTQYFLMLSRSRSRHTIAGTMTPFSGSRLTLLHSARSTEKLSVSVPSVPSKS